jgi:hypothetical protein
MTTQRRTSSARTVREVASLLGLDADRLGEASASDLARSGREALRRVASLLGVTGVSRLRLQELAVRLQGPLQELAQELLPVANAGEQAARSKFELGRPAEQPTPQHVPWSYGRDRVTAMVVDPERMFAYWEVRDDSIEAARRSLGQGGPSAWLTLRVYDVSGRIFDGTNAHRYFDVKVERGDRQWFLQLGEPGSSWCVEVGMKSHEGYFQRIARSARVDFPRRGPGVSGAVEWMTVRAATGEAEAPFAFGSLPPRAAAPPPPVFDAAPRAHVSRLVEAGWHEEVGLAHETVELGSWEERRELRSEWSQHGERLEWVGPVARTSWQAGPFSIPVEPPRHAVERWQFEGPVSIEAVGGRTRVVYGPWQVVIRGIDAHAERRVLATWRLEASWITAMGRERALEVVRRAGPRADQAGASEGVGRGASERVWMSGSELRLLGASELFLLGASERLFGGASELAFLGGSEWSYRGASERRLLGASEILGLGASERIQLGASEAHLGAGSEARLGGASERHRFPRQA